MGTPLADRSCASSAHHGSGAVTSSFFYHYARLIEILAAIERIELLLDDPDMLSSRLRAERGHQSSSKASASARRRAARCSTTTRSTSTA